MQTFLPYPDFQQSLGALDYRRLGKQRVEAFQILNVLTNSTIKLGWRNHPAVLMWKGYERGLWKYVQAMIFEARNRGIKTENNEANLNRLKELCWDDWGNTAPSFWNDTTKLMRVVTTHKASLFNKDPLQYIRFQSSASSPYNITCCNP